MISILANKIKKENKIRFSLFAQYDKELMSISHLPKRPNSLLKKEFEKMLSTPTVKWIDIIKIKEKKKIWIGFLVLENNPIREGRNKQSSPECFIAEAFILKKYRNRGFMEKEILKVIKNKGYIDFSLFIINENKNAYEFWNNVFKKAGYELKEKKYIDGERDTFYLFCKK